MEKQSTNQNLSNNSVSIFEKNLAEFTGAPYAIATDCCTHALELCLRLLKPKEVTTSCYTYLSVPMTLKKLKIKINWSDEMWIGEYQLQGTRIWDSARLLHPMMYRKGQLQCLSFGHGKPLDAKGGGAILCDSKEDYKVLKEMSHDGRDLSFGNWVDQKEFNIGFHYNMPFEHAEKCNILLEQYKQLEGHLPKIIKYPDCRTISIKG